MHCNCTLSDLTTKSPSIHITLPTVKKAHKTQRILKFDQRCVIRIMETKSSLSTHDMVVCKHIFPELHVCGVICFHDDRQLQVEKQITEVVQNHTETLLFWFPSHFPVQSECKHQKKQWSLPVLCTRHYFVLSVSVCLSSSDLIQRSFDSPHSALNPSLSSSSRTWQPTLQKPPPNMQECMGNIASWNATGNHCQPTKEQGGSHKPSQSSRPTLQHSQSLVDGPF